MVIKDSIYGEFTIEPIFEALINTQAMQRLKNIHQGGSSFLINPKWNVTRYEHSVGTMLLIRLLGGSIEEQIAGLLHDISHTAFSHVIDYVLENDNEDYHEQIYNKVINNSDIPSILKNYGYNSSEILYDDSRWTILEQAAPKLCADRVDYTLRDMTNNGIISIDEANTFLDNLLVKNGEIVVTSIKSAEWFVTTYNKEVIGYFMNPLAIFSYDRLSKALKVALNLKIIYLDDFLNDDNYILSKLKTSNSKEIHSLLNELNPNAIVIETKNDYDIHKVNKLRTVDPGVLINNAICKSSDFSPLIVKENKIALEKALEGIYIKLI